MVKAELTTIEAACDREHHSPVSCGSICCLFSFVLDDVLSIIHTVFLNRYSRCKNVFLESGTIQPTCHTSLDSGGGKLITAHPAVTCPPLQWKSKAAARDTAGRTANLIEL
jgi:hypothetical protein